MSLEKENKKRGRPRGKVRETHTVYLRLPTAMVAQIRLLAREKGWTVNRWVETVLQNVIRKDGRSFVLRADGGRPDGSAGREDGDGRSPRSAE